MKKKRTYAARAKSIQARYPHADRVSADREALNSEMLALFEEQEAYKQANGMGQPTNNQFAGGGKAERQGRRAERRYDRGVRKQARKDAREYDRYKRKIEKDDGKGDWFGAQIFADYLPTFEELQTKNVQDPIGFSSKIDSMGSSVLSGYGTSGIKEQEFGSLYYDTKDGDKGFWNASNMNIGAGVASGLGDIANMLSVRDPKRINPHTVNPTFSFQESDLTPYTTALDKELASTRYGFLEAGADFDTASAGVIRANDSFATNRGQLFLEQSRLNQEEAKRGDSIMNTGLYFNATNENQADIDLATRTDAAQQKRRDYLASLSDSISNIFKDEADRMLGEELSPYMKLAAAAEAHVKNS